MKEMRKRSSHLKGGDLNMTFISELLIWMNENRVKAVFSAVIGLLLGLLTMLIL